MNYVEQLTISMKWLGEKPDTYFIGQSVEYKGTGMHATLAHIPNKSKKEYFISENNQLGVSIGMALNGSKVISIFPRWNFLVCAFDQLYNHLEKISTYSHGDFCPSLIIRTGIGSIKPLDAQIQHTQDLTDFFKPLLKHIEVIRLDKAEDIFPSYQKAYNRTDNKSTLLVEWSDAYNPDFKIEDYNK